MPFGRKYSQKNIFYTSESKPEIHKALQQMVPQAPRPSKIKATEGPCSQEQRPTNERVHTQAALKCRQGGDKANEEKSVSKEEQIIM